MKTFNIQHSTFNTPSGGARWGIGMAVIVATLLMTTAQAQGPPLPPKAMRPAKMVKGAQVQMESARTSLVVTLPKTNYVQVQFDVDRRNGTPGYANFTTYLQISPDYKTWRDIGKVSGPTNGAFAVPVTKKTNQFFRTRWDTTR